MALEPHQQFLVDFKFDQVPATIGLNISDSVAAEMLGISAADFDAEIQKIGEEVNAAATQLLAEPDVARGIAKWELGESPTVMFAGDSITALRRSYAEILRVMLTRAQPDVKLNFQNVADPGFTSGNALQDTYTTFLSKNPAWVFVFYGTNDAQHVESVEGRSLVSPEEYRNNIRAIVKAFQTHTAARMVLIAPPPLLDKQANEAYGKKHIAYSTATVAKYAGVMKEVAAEAGLPCVDLFALFGTPPDAKYFGPDGLHPNLAGQMEMVRAVLRSIG